MKNFLIKLLLSCRSKKKERHSSTKKFLIVSTTGLGDTLWATPSIKALRETYPHSEIHVLTSGLGAQVLQNNPHIDQLFVISDPLFFSLFCLFFVLKKKNFDAIFIFHSSQRLIFPFCALLGAPKIVGTKGLNKDLDFILTHPLEKKEQHEIERRLEMVAQVNAKAKEQTLEQDARAQSRSFKGELAELYDNGARSSDPLTEENLLCSNRGVLQFFPGQEEEKKIERFLSSHKIEPFTLLIGLHPGAQNLFKQWNPMRFVELGLKLKEKWDCKIIISGNQEEALLVAEIASKIPDSIPVAGELSLSAFAALQKKMALFITNDTGPMHLAFAMNTPTIALFGPTDHRLCGPHKADKAVVIQKKKTCTPCLMKKCEEPFCLLQIGVNEVYEKALELIK
jgi:ADP-heptose:LPS heptosyltransferase